MADPPSASAPDEVSPDALWLGIETATRLGSVALVNAAGELRCERAADVQGTHASRLMGAIESLLEEAGQPLSTLTGVGVSIGPGSFTGLRVGLATAMGLGRAAGLPLVPVSTLETMAWAMPQPHGHLLAVALHARRGELYGAVYEQIIDAPGLALRTVMEPDAYSPQAFAELLADLPQPVLVAGTALAGLAFAGQVALAPAPFAHPRAALVAWRAASEGLAGAVPARDLTPHYLRASQAERALAERAAQVVDASDTSRPST